MAFVPAVARKALASGRVSEAVQSLTLSHEQR